MSKTNNQPVYVCPHCEGRYILGKNGTVDGCDVCLNVIRNTDGTVIEEDTLTDMEKA